MSRGKGLGLDEKMEASKGARREEGTRKRNPVLSTERTKTNEEKGKKRAEAGPTGHSLTANGRISFREAARG